GRHRGADGGGGQPRRRRPRPSAGGGRTVCPGHPRGGGRGRGRRGSGALANRVAGRAPIGRPRRARLSRLYVITYKRMPVREWDGTSYDRISGTMEALGLEVLERLELRGDELVLDAGCGSGRITAALIERLPRGRVIAVDGSESMAAAARRRLGPQADVRVGDLLALELGAPVDAILSTATFHW